MNNKSIILKRAQKISTFLALIVMVFGFWPQTTQAALVVSTRNASNITYSSATLNGILNEGSLSITAWFELGTDPNNLSLSTSPKYYNSLSDDYSTSVGGLQDNTTYYFRTVAQNTEGRAYGNILSFKTSYQQYNTNTNNNSSYYGSQPAITTNPATNVIGNSAILNAFVNGNGLATTAWFEWGTNTNFPNSTTQNYYGSSVSNYNITLTGLTPNTVYYFRAVAQNTKGRVFGNTVSFTTNSSYVGSNYPLSYPTYYPTQATASYGLSTITDTASNVASTSAQLNGAITNQGNQASNTWFEWGTDFNLTNKTEIVSTGAYPLVKHINKLSGLNPGTTYYFRIVADNGLSRNAGAINHFTTSGSAVGTNTKTTTNTTIKNSATVTPVNKDVESTISNLGANAIGASFLPGNLFGWLLIIIFILLLVLLVQHSFAPKPTIIPTPPGHGTH